MEKKPSQCALAIFCGAVLALTALWLCSLQAARAIGDIRYVAPPPVGNDSGNFCGSFSNPCATLQHAVDVAAPGDEIQLAGGIYTRFGTLAEITKTIMITGGYKSDFTLSDPDQYPTVLNSQSNGSVVSVTAAGEVSLANLTIIQGQGTSNCGVFGCGGGIYAQDVRLIVKNCIISDSLGSKGSGGWGGGIYASNSQVTILNSQIINNIGADETDTFGRGGGVSISGGEFILRESKILGNVGHTSHAGSGGGIHLSGVTYAEILSNTISGNRGSLGDWRSDAGGIWIDHAASVLIAGNRIENNSTSSHLTNGAGYGGGVYIWDSRVTLDRNIITGNSSGSWVNALRPGGGLAIQGNQPVTLTNNLIAHNSGGSYGDGVYVGLGWGPVGQTLLVNNTIADNGETGIVASLYANLSLTNNLISGHDVGLVTYQPFTGTIIADHNLFWNTTDPIIGSNAIQQFPRLTADYRLGSGSPALDAGLTILWLAVDLDGEPRPQAGFYDIGAYEGEETLLMIYLPLVRR